MDKEVAGEARELRWERALVNSSLYCRNCVKLQDNTPRLVFQTEKCTSYLYLEFKYCVVFNLFHLYYYVFHINFLGSRQTFAPLDIIMYTACVTVVCMFHFAPRSHLGEQKKSPELRSKRSPVVHNPKHT